MTEPFEQLEVSRLINANLERVFEAWTNPNLIVRWWGAGDVRCTAAEMDLTTGGSYRIANQTPDGTTMWITGTFSHIDPPNGLTYTWAMEPLTADTQHSIVEVRFAATPDGTLVTIHHTRISSVDARDTNLQGWTGCLTGLDHLLSP
jgi:uncharacterized protein YndB with AHSA1/START domain